jgi:hypothetical protein
VALRPEHAGDVDVPFAQDGVPTAAIGPDEDAAALSTTYAPITSFVPDAPLHTSDGESDDVPALSW